MACLSFQMCCVWGIGVWMKGDCGQEWSILCKFPTTCISALCCSAFKFHVHVITQGLSLLVPCQLLQFLRNWSLSLFLEVLSEMSWCQPSTHQTPTYCLFPESPVNLSYVSWKTHWLLLLDLYDSLVIMFHLSFEISPNSCGWSYFQTHVPT